MTLPPPSANRDFALDVVRRLREGGFAAYWAGGCVRDQLLGRIPKDYDVATDARPEQIRDLFGPKRTLAIGQSFGVMTVLGSRRVAPIEVATFREDVSYTDGRHPDAIRFSHARQDAMRRDFTINGIFFDPLADEIVDFVGGQQDLKRGLIRAIGAPEQRLEEDKLRMLRAVRFAAEFGFTVEAETLDAIRHHAREIIRVSAERITSELERMLIGPRAGIALELLRDTGLWGALFSGPAWSTAEFWARAGETLKHWKPRTFPQSLAGLALLTGPDPVPRNGLDELRQPLRLSNQQVREADFYLHSFPVLRSANRLPWPKVQPLLVEPWAQEAVELAEKLLPEPETEQALALCRARLNWPAERLDPPRLVTGQDLKSLGLSPGPKFRKILQDVRDRQLLGELSTREAALAWLAERQN